VLFTHAIIGWLTVAGIVGRKAVIHILFTVTDIEDAFVATSMFIRNGGSPLLFFGLHKEKLVNGIPEFLAGCHYQFIGFGVGGIDFAKVRALQECEFKFQKYVAILQLTAHDATGGVG